VAQFGAGGAGAATAYAVLAMGAGQVLVVDVDHERASALAGAIQATPIGMASHPGMPFDAGLMRADQWLAEVIYFPIETALLGAARERGCATLDGSGMAIFQAVKAFELFTGRQADPVRMRKVFDASSQ
jgi:shikimate dehydrogenase